MDIVSSIQDLRVSLLGRRQAHRTGLVPTMGALHDGHLSLIAAAQREADRIAATIFVNPTQFAAGEDFTSYPKTLDADLEALEHAGCDVVFVPAVETMYPTGSATTVTVNGPLTQTLEGAHRPHFFGGVATVVTKLLAAAQADVAVFGEKDYQQLKVIERMAADLLLGTEIIGAPTVRAKDGLALSSRNTYLSPSERDIAPHLYRALTSATDAIAAGADPRLVTEQATKDIQSAGFASVDYLDYRAAKDLAQPQGALPVGQGRLLAAAWLGTTRLIDNVSA
ncbi:pantoate--beta-alanine ligase [Alphaproteobacteria bacterium]|jgi:pantoate--beta-alanine ligase|nr:pantoate--beta-alanine ligase [Alphaproteobacteria bacterium]MDG1413903.1 pantoate--beta-alanine ligase [Alphaproteobacteria bacterium]